MIGCSSGRNSTIFDHGPDPDEIFREVNSFSFFGSFKKFVFRKTLLLMNLDDNYHLESEFYCPDELENHVENVVGNVNKDDQPELKQRLTKNVYFSSLNMTKK